MKKFKFKLEGLLKVREQKEDKLKIELGEILKEISYLNSEIIEIRKSIEMAYTSQSSRKGVFKANILGFYPDYIQGRRSDILNKENLLSSLNSKYEEKAKELNIARGEFKVIQQLKDKECLKHKKEFEKKEQQKIDDIMLMIRSRKEM